MACAYAQNKNSIYNYRRTHSEKVKEINRNANKRRYYWLNIQRTFLRILADDDALHTCREGRQN